MTQMTQISADNFYKYNYQRSVRNENLSVKRCAFSNRTLFFFYHIQGNIKMSKSEIRLRDGRGTDKVRNQKEIHLPVLDSK